MTATATKTSLKKWIRAYSISFNSSKVGSYFLELNDCIKVQAFSRRSRAVTTRNYTKKRDTRAELLFYKSKPFTFLPFSLTSPSSLLKLPNGTVWKIIDLHKFARGKYGTKKCNRGENQRQRVIPHLHTSLHGVVNSRANAVLSGRKDDFAVNLAIWYIVFF